jgi:hypothetical protein
MYPVVLPGGETNFRLRRTFLRLGNLYERFDSGLGIEMVLAQGSLLDFQDVSVEILCFLIRRQALESLPGFF